MTPSVQYTLSILLLLGIIASTSCTSALQGTDNAEKGRIIHKDSAAVVGPLLDTRQENDVPQEAGSQEKNASVEVSATPAPINNKPKESEPAVVLAKPVPASAPQPAQKLAATSSAPVTKTPQSVENINKKSTETKKTETKKLNAQVPASSPSIGSVVKGKIKFLDENREPIHIEGSIVVLKPLFDTTQPLSEKVGQQHHVDMKDKIYTPRYLAVNKNDTLVFVNKDQIKHNVFSSSGKNAFDLGTYGSGKQRAVNLGETGIVKVYCNIHPEMATFVSVNDHAANTVTDENGNFELRNVQGGEYELHIWHVRGEKKMTIQVSDKAENFYQINVDTAPVIVENHKNKFGKEYSKNSALFEDEFY